MLYRVVVGPAPGMADLRGQGLRTEIKSLGIAGVGEVETADLYFLEGELAPQEVERLASELMADPVVQRYHWQQPDGSPLSHSGTGASDERDSPLPHSGRGASDECDSPLPHSGRGASDACDSPLPHSGRGASDACDSPLPRSGRGAGGEGTPWVVEVALRPGVTDAVAGSLLDGARLLGVEGLTWAATGQRYVLHGRLGEAEVHRIARSLLCNEVIQEYRLGPVVPARTAAPRGDLWVETVPVRQASAEALMRLSRERLLSLDEAEMAAIQAYFVTAGRDPTDVELETLAQTWSEHCVHKTFKALVDYEEYADGVLVRRERIDGLLRTFIRAATEEIAASWVLSAFVDNAGIIDFDGRHEVSFKVETHNHPSALEPFGGANTGVGGVVRDIIGVSARPIANTDVLCFGPQDLPFAELPPGVLHPRRVYSGVVAGIEDYGNKMGIPTVNGAILFHPGYTANPLVYCGCVGLAPKGRHRNQARPGDRVLVLGGRTGRDGLHGATFSSVELTHETGTLAGGAVQIGNPITEKLVLEAILEARDQGLYMAITDCGAGGLSSAVGEMGRATGVTVQLEEVPLKYQGLLPWEIWLSEAQERMVLAVAPAQVAGVLEICRRWDVEATVIGTFRDDGRLVVRYGDETVADLAMAFLHDGMPRRSLQAVWRGEALTPDPSPTAGERGGALAAGGYPSVGGEALTPDPSPTAGERGGALAAGVCPSVGGGALTPDPSPTAGERGVALAAGGYPSVGGRGGVAAAGAAGCGGQGRLEGLSSRVGADGTGLPACDAPSCSPATAGGVSPLPHSGRGAGGEGIPSHTGRGAGGEGIPSHTGRGAGGEGTLPEAAEILLRLLAHPDVASKEAVIRRYDHEVQGGTAVKPLVGRHADGPSDAAVLVPLDVVAVGEVGAPRKAPVRPMRALAVGCGIAPRFGARDPYAMAVAAVDEAVRNVVAVGADPARIALLDNFCWGNPQRPEQMGALVQAARGCHDAALAYRAPFVSGKDSLNNEYGDSAGGRTAIPPTLLISALGIVPEVGQAVTMDLKECGNALYLLGQTRRELGESYLFRQLGLKGGTIPQPAPDGPALAQALHGAMRDGLVRACHDLSEGGLAVAAAEMALAGDVGLHLDLAQAPRDADVTDDLALLFAESNARYLVEVRPEDEAAFAATMAGLPCACVGRVECIPHLVVSGLDGAEVANLPIRSLRRAWKGEGV